MSSGNLRSMYFHFHFHLHLLEQRRKKKTRVREEAKTLEIRPLPDHLRDTWHKAYEWWTVQPAPAQYVDQFQRFISQAGMTDRLIVAVIERALQLARRHPLAWAQTVLAGLVPYGITTPEAWAEFEEQQATEEQRIAQEQEAARAQTRATAQTAAGSNKRRPPDSNVFLRREKKDDTYYDHIFQRFDDKPGGGEH